MPRHGYGPSTRIPDRILRYGLFSQPAVPPPLPPTACPTCRGLGRVFRFAVAHVCPACAGSGARDA